jgi:hypothetical protein
MVSQSHNTDQVYSEVKVEIRGGKLYESQSHNTDQVYSEVKVEIRGGKLYESQSHNTDQVYSEAFVEGMAKVKVIQSRNPTIQIRSIPRAALPSPVSRDI